MVKPFLCHCCPEVRFESPHGTKGTLTHCIRGGKDQNELKKSDNFTDENELIF